MDVQDSTRLHADTTSEESARFVQRLFVGCLVVAIACGILSAAARYAGPIAPNLDIAICLAVLSVVLMLAAVVSSLLALSCFIAWIGVLLNIWIRKRSGDTR